MSIEEWLGVDAGARLRSYPDVRTTTLEGHPAVCGDAQRQLIWMPDRSTLLAVGGLPCAQAQRIAVGLRPASPTRWGEFLLTAVDQRR